MPARRANASRPAVTIRRSSAAAAAATTRTPGQGNRMLLVGSTRDRCPLRHETKVVQYLFKNKDSTVTGQKRVA